MNGATPVVRQFLEECARSRSAGDIDGIVSQYADRCMLAPPEGPVVVERAALLEGFTKAMEVLKAAGHTSTDLGSLDETSVGGHYSMVRAQFVWHFEKAANRPGDFTVDITFLLHMRDGLPQIVFHHEHQDFFQVLRTHGVLPAQ